MEKRPFDVEVAMARVREAVRPYPPAAMFQLADEGYRTLFEQLVACMISVRTRDETSLVLARRLFARARTPEAMAALDAGAIERLINASTFHQAKAPNILAIARRAVDEFRGELPCDDEVLVSLPGIGPKCAHLALGIACGLPRIAVDVHVHRVTNRWGYVAAATPEKTMEQLERVLPERYWIEINRLLVPFGKHVCLGVAPRCPACPLLDMCRQVGVRATS